MQLMLVCQSKIVKKLWLGTLYSVIIFTKAMFAAVKEHKNYEY
jgi:hypothetical protein